MKKWGRFGVAAAMLVAVLAFHQLKSVRAAGGPAQGEGGPYRVLAPIVSGNLLLFPVVRDDGKSTGETPFITLDDGLKSGEVEVTEAGRARGLVRPRGSSHSPARDNLDRGDEVLVPDPGWPNYRAIVELAGGNVRRLRLRTSSYANWPAVATAVVDNLLPDFPLINKSFELCYACVDR